MLIKLGYSIPEGVYTDDREKNYLKIAKNDKTKTENHCCDCGALISANSTRCLSCYLKIRSSNSIKPEREELKMKIRTIPFTTIAKEYGVTDNAVRKWCDKYDLPRKKSVINQISDEDWDLI